jgi:copper(I)-binding protein
VSRAQQNSTGRRRLATAASGLALTAVLGAAGCSAGQITQTDSQLPAVIGASAQSGPIAVRDAKLAFPHEGFYAAGDDAPLILSIINTAAADDELLEVSSPFATEVKLTGDKLVPGTAALAVGKPGEEAKGKAEHAEPTGTAHPTSESAHPTSGAAHATTPAHPGTTGPAPTSVPTTSAAPTSKAKTVGTCEIILSGLKEKLHPGRSIPVTFVFAKAGTITIELPFAAPSGPRGESGDH